MNTSIMLFNKAKAAAPSGTKYRPGAQLGNFEGGGRYLYIGFIRIILYIALAQVSNVMRLCLEMQERACALTSALPPVAPLQRYRL